MYLVGFFDRILKYCLSSDISRKKVFFDSPNNEMEKENCRCRFWSNSWSKMGHGVELLDLGHLMVLSHSMHFLDIKGVAHARHRWTLTVSVPCGINKLPNRVSLLNTLYYRPDFGWEKIEIFKRAEKLKNGVLGPPQAENFWVQNPLWTIPPLLSTNF